MDISVFTLFLAVFVSSASCQNQPVVTTAQGEFFGKLTTVPNHGEVKEFLGVPYAEPPLRDLRLKPPEQVKSQLTYDAIEYKPVCVQNLKSFLNFNFNDEIDKFIMDENCLYLNVYVPVSDEGNLPVMVFIHGGGFFVGSGSSYNGRVLAAKGQVIVVTINYRLGLLGFFPNGGPESTLGLQDQIMALKWVKTSISAFGGDPNQVTIFGESAGGASVDFLSRSPKARGLFQRVISQSGVATSPWALRPEKRKNKMNKITDLFHQIGCASSEVLDCMKQASTDQIVNITKQMGLTTPEIDHDVIMEDYATNTSLIHPDLEFITGTLPNEGASLVHILCSNMNSAKCDQGKGVSLQALSHVDILYSDIDVSSDTLLKYYNHWYPSKIDVQTGNLNLDAGSLLATDTGFKVSHNMTASRLAQAGFAVHVYEFNAVSNFSPFPPIPWSSKAQHSDELSFVFGLPPDGPDGKVADGMIKLWSDFAHGRLNEETWAKFTTTRGEYLYIDKEHHQGVMRSPYFPQQKNPLWRSYLDKGVFPPFNNGSGSQFKSGDFIAVTMLAIIAMYIRYF